METGQPNAAAWPAHLVFERDSETGRGKRPFCPWPRCIITAPDNVVQRQFNRPDGGKIVFLDPGGGNSTRKRVFSPLFNAEVRNFLQFSNPKTAETSKE